MEDKNKKEAPKETLEKRIGEWKAMGKTPEQITYGLLNEGFQSLPGIPDDFCSAEDPRDRAELWNERQPRQQGYRDFYGDDEPLYNNGKGDN